MVWLIEIRGIGISGQKANGKAHICRSIDKHYHNFKTYDAAFEKQRLDAIIRSAEMEIEKLMKSAMDDDNDWQIFETHKWLTEDVEIKKYICNLIDHQGYDLLSALDRTKDDMKAHFLNMESENFRSKVSDLEDIFERLIKHEIGLQDENQFPKEPFILVCDEILPSMIYQYPLEYLKGIIVKFGSNCSHGAMLARKRNIPVIIRVKNKIDLIKDSFNLQINGESGNIYLLDA